VEKQDKKQRAEKMTYIYRLAGENLDLAQAELNGFLESQEIEEKSERNGRLAETNSEPDQLKRMALTHEVCRKKSETELNELEINFKIEGSFAVKCKILEGETDSKKMEKELGSKVSNEETSVDLENPETVIYAYVQNDRVLIGELVQKIPRGLFGKRSNEKRPFSSPVSLDPVLAQVLVNLSEVPAGEKILDPFCGTGGILIEAGLCGILPLGTDAKKEMVSGTEENLEKYGILNHNIRELDAKKSLEKFDPDAVVTDLPYGKASKVEGEIEQKFLELIKEFDRRVVFMYDKPELGELEAEYQVYVHKNLTRHIFCE
jgi:tRNA (guanine10-N2)-dimethyltransferase